MGFGRPLPEKGKRCPFKQPSSFGSKLCEKQSCALWTGEDKEGECALLMLALDFSEFINKKK